MAQRVCMPAGGPLLPGGGHAQSLKVYSEAVARALLRPGARDKPLARSCAERADRFKKVTYETSLLRHDGLDSCRLPRFRTFAELPPRIERRQTAAGNG